MITFPFTKLSITSFPLRAVFLAAMLLCIAIGSIYFLLDITAERENLRNQQVSRHLASTAVKQLENEAATLAKEYAWWDDLIARLGNRNEQTEGWLNHNYGNYLHDNYDVSATFILNEDYTTVFSFQKEREGMQSVGGDAFAFLGGGATGFLNELQKTDVAESIPLTTFVNYQDRMFIVAAAPITAENLDAKSQPRFQRPVLVLIWEIDETLIDEFSTEFLLPGLALRIGAPAEQNDVLAITNVDKATLAYLQWIPNRSGDEFVADLMPKISLLIAIVFIILMMILWDIANRRVDENKTLLEKSAAENANTAKSEFLASMSHDLRTPLNAILGFSDIMRNETYGPLGASKYLEYAQDIHNSGGLLISLINDILDVSKVEAGKYELFEEYLDVSVLIQRSIKMFSTVANADNILFEVNVSPNFLELYGDERAITQVLNNLISNAINFTSSGGTIFISANLDKDNSINILVADTGVGMSETDITKAQKPFEQINSSVTRHYNGTGLGLYICQNLVLLHDGQMKMKSEIGEGTTVTVRFPPQRTVSAAA